MEVHQKPSFNSKVVGLSGAGSGKVRFMPSEETSNQPNQAQLSGSETESAGQPEVALAQSAASSGTAPEPNKTPVVNLSMPNFSSEIDRLQELVQSASENPSATKSEMEEVQNGLISNLDRLNKYIEDYVEVLGNNRKMAS